jgi:hypothetical protein
MSDSYVGFNLTFPFWEKHIAVLVQALSSANALYFAAILA